MGKNLVFVGGGHAHMTSLKNLSYFKKLGHHVTLISSSPYHYYSGMGPGMLSGIYHPWEVRFHVKRLAEDRGATFIKGKAIKVDPVEHLIFLDSGEKVHYDVASFNTGSEVPIELLTETPEDNLFPVKPVINLLRGRQAILEAIRNNKMLHFVVVGGGPAGVEISASLLRLLHKNHGKGEITLIGGKRLLGDAPDRVRHLAMESLTRRGVQIIEGSHVKAIEKGKVTLSDGKRFDMNFAFIAIGIRPASLFRDSGIPTGADGGLLVNSHLQSVAHPDIFGGGDCISLEGHQLAKVGVYAVRENPVLYHNLIAALEGGKKEAFTPQTHFLLIFNMGNGKGIYWKKNWVWEGRLAFFLKDYIDRKFMKTFQISGELDERLDRIE
jgi:NADH dehydrogenase FAD-containing subunit